MPETTPDELTPEDALAMFPVPELTAVVLHWVAWAASNLTTGWERRCLLEELADTHCPEAAAACMADPALLARTWATVDRKGADRAKLAGYLARKALRSGRSLDSLTAKQGAAARFLLEQAAQKVAMDRPLTKAERELAELVGLDAVGAEWV
jgi:hypothetical protein